MIKDQLKVIFVRYSTKLCVKETNLAIYWKLLVLHVICLPLCRSLPNTIGNLSGVIYCCALIVLSKPMTQYKRI